MQPVFEQEIALSPAVFETILRGMMYMGAKGFKPRGNPEDIKYFIEEETMTLLMVIPTKHDEEGESLHTLKIPSKHWSFKDQNEKGFIH